MAPDRENTDPSSLAAAASEQVRAIIEAAEQTAAQIRAKAEDEAAGIRRQAEEDATGIASQARGDVQALLDSIRTAAGSIGADVAQLEERLAAPPPPPEPAPPPPEPEPEPELFTPAPAGSDDADIESARLVALNMALDGASRDEVDGYLKEHFGLSDREALLDDVYASVGS
jgi:multidrug efflux pump subunit AcrA (membrane-fusion protein)